MDRCSGVREKEEESLIRSSSKDQKRYRGTQGNKKT